MIKIKNKKKLNYLKYQNIYKIFIIYLYQYNI